MDKFVKHLYHETKTDFSASESGDYLNHYWENDDQMKALKMMMQFDLNIQDNDDWQNSTRYLIVQAKEFKEAEILPKVEEVYNTHFQKSPNEDSQTPDNPT
jgi:hypothetical protein